MHVLTLSHGEKKKKKRPEKRKIEKKITSVHEWHSKNITGVIRGLRGLIIVSTKAKRRRDLAEGYNIHKRNLAWQMPDSI